MAILDNYTMSNFMGFFSRPIRACYFSLFQNFQTISVAHPTSYWRGSSVFRGDKAAGVWY